MKNFIQYKLRLVLEGRYTNQKDLERFRFKMAKYASEFKGDPYFQNISAGDGVYRVIFNKQGKSIKSSRIGDAKTMRSAIGPIVNIEDPNLIGFNIAAGRGVEHKGTYKDREYDAKTRKGELADNKPGSPMSDAVIKAILNHGEDILNHMGEVKYTDGDSGAKRAVTMNDPELVKTVADKYAKAEKPKGAKSSEEEKSLVRQKVVLNDKLSQLRRSFGKDARIEIRDIKRQLKVIDAEIKKLNSGWDEFRKSKDKSIGI